MSDIDDFGDDTDMEEPIIDPDLALPVESGVASTPFSGEWESSPLPGGEASIAEKLAGISEVEPEDGMHGDPTGLGNSEAIYHHVWEELPDFISEAENIPLLDDDINIYGTPWQDIELWDGQDDLNSCAVATTNMIFRSWGLDPGEDLLADIFQDYGIYDPMAGTSPFYIDDVLNDVADRMNLDMKSYEINGFDAADLKAMLQNGIRPLIAVDAHMIYPEWMPPGSGHAVQLTSIIEDGDHHMAIINDPGFEEGAGVVVPLEDLFSAAAPFDNTAITVTVA